MDGGATALGGERPPQLHAGSYAAWKRRMDVWLVARYGRVHTEARTEEEWKQDFDSVAQWQREEDKQARAAAYGEASVGSDSKEDARQQQARHEGRSRLKALVQQSDRAFGAIWSALPEDLQLQVAHVAEGWAYGLWKWLETKFQSTEADNVASLLHRWFEIRQEEDETFDAYRARVNAAHALLQHAKQQQTPEVYALILLERLQPRYTPVVLALKAGPLLQDKANINWDAVATLVNAHERKEAEFNGGADGKAMAARAEVNRPRHLYNGSAAAKHAEFTFRGKGSTHGHAHHGASSFEHEADAGRGRGVESRRARFESHSGNPDKVCCWVCGKPGHMARRCPDRKGARGYNEAGSQGRSAGSSSGERSPRKEQASMATTGNALASSNEREVAYMTRRVLPKESTVSSNHEKIKALEARTWGVDSMASLGISGNKDLFTSLHPCEPVVVSGMESGSTVTATLCGSVELHLRTENGDSVSMVVDDIYYHPSFAANLLSWNVLRTKGWELHSDKAETFVLTPCGNKVRLSIRDRVSILNCTGDKSESEIKEPAAGQVYTVASTAWNTADELMELHNRLTHVGFDRMVRIVKSGATLDLGRLNVSETVLKEARRRVQECPACVQGKGTRTAFGHRGVDRGSAPGEVLHMDTFYVRFDRDGQSCLEYGLVVTDPHSTFRWVARLRTKDEGAAEVIQIVRMARTQLGCSVKRLYADGGTEFINQTLTRSCSAEGIELHYPPARTPQLNSIAERLVRWSKDTARTMLFHSGLPARFWWRAASHACFVWNRTNIAPATGVTPFEAMFKRKPSAEHWGAAVFGCDAYFHVPKEQREVFGAKMEPCIYLGHDGVQNCAVVFDLRTCKEVRTRDVEYRSTRFTHAIALQEGGEHVSDILAKGFLEDKNPVPARSLPSRVDFDRRRPPEQAQQYEVERIIGKRTRDGTIEYRIKWADYAEDDCSWEPASNIELGAQDAIDEFEARQLEEPSAQLRSSAEAPAAAASAAPGSESGGAAAMDAGASQAEDERAAVPSAAPAAAPASTAPRRSPRNHESSASVDVDTTHRVHMAVQAIQRMNLDAQMEAEPASPELVCAVMDGLSLLEERTPKSHAEAMASADDASRWRAAEKKELDSIESMGVWHLVPRSSVSKGQTVLPIKWVYRIKVDEHGAVSSYKARLTPKGFLQREGVNYFETFAATGQYKTMRIGLSLAARFDHELDQLDVPTAFLWADVEEDVYVGLPPGYEAGKEGMVYKLRKALYGLKQAPRNWYLLVSKFIVEVLGYKATVSDRCLFYKRSATGRLMLLFLFVDDMQSSYDRVDKSEWEEIKAKLVARFHTKDMGPSTWILGMRIQRNRAARTITLDQELYITKALERYGLRECKVAATPEAVGGEATESAVLDQPDDRQLFMEMTGTLMYAAISCRPDISHAVHALASAMQAPTERHMVAAKRVLRYLAGTKEVGLVFGSRNGSAVSDSRGWTTLPVDVCAFADADWANDKADRKSITGWVAKVSGDPVSWTSKKQRVVAQSTCEAELYAEAAAIQEVLWLRGLLKELGLHMKAASVVHGDNQSAIAVSKNGIRGERTKHVDVKYCFITETIESGTVQLKCVTGANLLLARCAYRCALRAV